jgi:predicted lysophospholipase L1 biosynthesis ABC-type transport system permease subunit
VLLISLANVMSLLLYKTAAREKEFALRAALGSGRAHLLSLSLMESLQLAAIGGTLGLVISAGRNSLLMAIAPKDRLHIGTPENNIWVVGFTVAAVLITGILCGTLSFYYASKSDLASVLKGQFRSAVMGQRSGSIRSLLTVFQIALSVVLLVCTTLLIKSFKRVATENTGFTAVNVVTMQIALSARTYQTGAQQISFSQALMEKSSVLPGVKSCSIASSLPILGVEQYTLAFRIIRQPGT